MLFQFLLDQKCLLGFILQKLQIFTCNSKQKSYLNKSMNGLIIGPISNEELHVFIFDLGGLRSDVLHPHVAHFLLDNKWCNSYFFSFYVFNDFVRHCFSLSLQCATLYEATKAEFDNLAHRCQSYKVVSHLTN